MQQRVGGVDEIRQGFAHRADVLFVETDARVFFQHRGAAFADDAVVVADAGGDVGDFVAPRFARVQAAAEGGEGFLEEGMNEVGLQAARFGFVHFFFDVVEVFQLQGLFGEGVAANDGVQVFDVQRAGDDFVHARLDFGLLAVADGVQQQFAQRFVGKGFAEDVEDFAFEGGAHGFDFVEEFLEDFAFAGFFGDEIPQVADFGLADAVDAAKTLFDAVRVPGQVVVDHQVGVLQVDAFAGRIRSNQDEHGGVVAEFFLYFAAFVAVGAARDGAHAFRTAEQVGDACGEVVQGVFVFGKDDEFAPLPVGIFHMRRIL